MHYFRRSRSHILEESEEHQKSQQENEQIMSSISYTFDNINSACTKSVRFASQIATNLAYRAKNSNLPIIKRQSIKLTLQGDPAIILGKSYDYDQQKQFIDKFRKIVWFTYRSQSEGKTSDAGWGCMIRVCQMVTAQFIKQTYPKQHISQIINQFSQEGNSLFSFDRICEIGSINQRWTSSTQIMGIIKKILDTQSKFRIGLQIYSCCVAIEDSQEQGIKYPLMVCVNNRLGESSIPKQYYDNILSLLKHPYSMGMIGGVGGQAVYVVGYQNKNMIILDPHYIQGQNNGERLHFMKTPRGIPIQKLMPSVSFCYLINNKNDHQKWIKDMAEINYFHYPYVSIEFDHQMAKKIYEQRHCAQDSDSQQFQVLQ